MRDEVRPLGIPLFSETTSVRVGADRVSFHGRNSLSTFLGDYRFEPEGGGTRVRLVADVHLLGLLKRTEFAARPIARALLLADLKAHVRELQEDLARGSRETR